MPSLVATTSALARTTYSARTMFAPIESPPPANFDFLDPLSTKLLPFSDVEVTKEDPRDIKSNPLITTGWTSAELTRLIFTTEEYIASVQAVKR